VLGKVVAHRGGKIDIGAVGHNDTIAAPDLRLLIVVNRPATARME
jgi:hypothetical protein